MYFLTMREELQSLMFYLYKGCILLFRMLKAQEGVVVAAQSHGMQGQPSVYENTHEVQ